MVGRPSKFTAKLADQICDRLALGESLRAICRDEAMPSQSMVFRWLANDASFREQYARAREVQADALFDEIIDIADTTKLGVKTVTKATGVEITEADMIEHRKLQIDARKWVAARLAPKKYADKGDGEGAGATTVVIKGGLPD